MQGVTPRTTVDGAITGLLTGVVHLDDQNFYCTYCYRPTLYTPSRAHCECSCYRCHKDRYQCECDMEGIPPLFRGFFPKQLDHDNIRQVVDLVGAMDGRRAYPVVYGIYSAIVSEEINRRRGTESVAPVGKKTRRPKPRG